MRLIHPLLSGGLILLFVCNALASTPEEFRRSIYEPPVAIQHQAAKNSPIKIATIYPDQQASDYWRRNLVSMTARLDALKINYRWQHYASRPSDSRQQEQQLSMALAEQPDFLVISIDSPRIRKLLGRILYRGTPKVIIPNQTISNPQWQEHPPLLYTGFDHIEGSRLLANALFERHGDNARYAIMYGTKGRVSELRVQGFHDVAIQRHAPPPVAEYYTDLSPEKIYLATADVLNNNRDLDFIFCITTDIALQVAKAVKDLGSEHVEINGWGGGSDELEALRQGKLAVTVMRMNDDTGVSIAEAIKFVLENRQDEVPARFCGELKLLTSADVSSIDQLKKRAFRYSESQ
nr:substrate-binding domain-containing protein [uncultured Desulfuromonas sp.]